MFILLKSGVSFRFVFVCVLLYGADFPSGSGTGPRRPKIDGVYRRSLLCNVHDSRTYAHWTNAHTTK